MKIMNIDKRKLKKEILKSIKIHIKYWDQLGIDYDSIPPLILSYKEQAFIYRTCENFRVYDKECCDYSAYVYLKYEYKSFTHIVSWENDYKEMSNYYNNVKIEYPFMKWDNKGLKSLCRSF